MSSRVRTILSGLTLYFGIVVYSYYCELKEIPQVRVQVQAPEPEKEKKPNKSSVRIGSVVTSVPGSVENRG